MIDQILVATMCLNLFMSTYRRVLFCVLAVTTYVIVFLCDFCAVQSDAVHVEPSFTATITLNPIDFSTCFNKSKYYKTINGIIRYETVMYTYHWVANN